MYRRFARLATNAAPRSAAVLALAGFLAGTIGVPLPQLKLPLQASATFPGQSHACGCAVAVQRTNSCCCFPRQAQRTDKTTNIRACCTKNELAGQSPASSKSSHTEHNRTDKHLEFVLVSTMQARRCQGQAELWMALGAVDLPPSAFSLILESPLCGDTPASTDVLMGVSLSPPPPPPRV